MFKEKCIKITLDTSVILPNSKELKQLVEWQKCGFVRLFVEWYSIIEKENWKNEEQRNKVIEWMHAHGYRD